MGDIREGGGRSVLIGFSFVDGTAAAGGGAPFLGSAFRRRLLPEVSAEVDAGMATDGKNDSDEVAESGSMALP